MKLIIMIIFVSFLLFSCGSETKEQPKEDTNLEHFNSGKKDLEGKYYDNAINHFKAIDDTSRLKKEADVFLNKAKEEQKEAIKQQTIEQLKREIEAIKKGIDYSSYRGDNKQLQIELVLFGTWNKVVEKGLELKDDEATKLSNQLRKLIEKEQIKEFPILRKEFVKWLKNSLWEKNVEVIGKGSGNKDIRFKATAFVNNKNIKDFQTDMSSIFKNFRFRNTEYLYSDFQSNYTYYENYKGKDGDAFVVD